MAEKPVTFISPKDVRIRTAQSRAGMYNAINAGTFPKPVPLNENGTRKAFIESEIEEWIAARIAARDVPRDPRPMPPKGVGIVAAKKRAAALAKGEAVAPRPRGRPRKHPLPATVDGEVAP